MKKRSLAPASLVSAILAGSWRQGRLPPIGICEDQLETVMPLLFASGSAALAWWRLRDTDLSSAPPVQMLHQAYRLQVLQSAAQEKKIEKVFRFLRNSSVDVILAKGWAAAGLYPERGLRPCGDIDLLCRPEHFQTAQEILKSTEARGFWVDLHLRFSELEPRSFNELFARSRLLDVGAEKIRILGPEDHLALLSIHLLKHGAWRPVWLCDIGAAIESLPTEFDWEICLGPSRTRARWIVSSIGLAYHLLGARIHSLPVAKEAMGLPSWLISSVSKQWSHLLEDRLPMRVRPLMAKTLRNRRGVLKGICERWPDPVTATFNLKGQFNDFPRLPYQLGDFLRSAGDFLFNLRRKLAVK